MKQSKTGRVPAWVLSHLKRYGNCAIGRKIANELGDELLPLLREEGYVCELSRSIIAGKEKAERPTSSDAYAETEDNSRTSYVGLLTSRLCRICTTYRNAEMDPTKRIA